MKSDNLFSQAMLVMLLPSAIAYPGGKMAKTLEDIKMKVKARGVSPIQGPDDSNELIGDLVKPGPTSDIGKVGFHDFVILGDCLTHNAYSLLPISYLARQMEPAAREIITPLDLLVVLNANKISAAHGNMLHKSSQQSSLAQGVDAQLMPEEPFV